MKDVFKIFLTRAGYRDALSRPSAWALIVVNLGLVAGVLAWNWSVFDIVFLYWVENLVIGAINVLKMLISHPSADLISSLESRLSALESMDGKKQMRMVHLMSGGLKLSLIPFFILHYGVFCYAHGVLVFSMFSVHDAGDGLLDLTTVVQLLTGPMILTIGLLSASHLFSFFRNFIGGGEYRRTHAALLMRRPYGRIVALHITIIFGGILAMAFGSQLGVLIVLVVLKTVVDLAMHEAERIKFSPSS